MKDVLDPSRDAYVVNNGIDPPRCKTCKAYICPQAEFDNSRWRCPLCLSRTSRVTHFASSYVTSRFPSDRPELFYSSVDYKVSDAYQARPPQPPLIFFVVETTRLARSQGLVNAAAEAIYDLLKNNRLPGMDREDIPVGTKFGLLTFDSEITFYRQTGVDPTTKAAVGFESIVLPDISEVFPKETVVFPPIKSDECIFTASLDGSNFADQILMKLPEMYPLSENDALLQSGGIAQDTAKESCLISAIRTAYLMMKQTGGKLITFASSPCTMGGLVPGPRHLKGDTKKPATPEELMVANHSSAALLKAFGEEFTKYQVSCDVFMCPPVNTYVDLASLTDFVHRSSGTLKYLPGFTYHSHAHQLRQILNRMMTRKNCWESIIKFRCSPNWKISHIEGNFSRRPDALIPLPCCHSDTIITVFLTPAPPAADGSNVGLPPNSPCYLQVALLYSDSYMSRRSRVHTLSIPTAQPTTSAPGTIPPASRGVPRISLPANPSKSIVALMQQFIRLTCPLVDNHSGISYGANPVLSTDKKQPNSDPFAIMKQKVDTMMDALMQNSEGGMEEASRYAPMLSGLLKHPAFRPFPSSNNASLGVYDTRIAILSAIASADIPYLTNILYPKLVQIYPFADDTIGTVDYSVDNAEADPKNTKMPSQLNLTKEVIRQNGIYAMADGDRVTVWVGNQVDPSIIQEIFQVANIEAVQPPALLGPSLEYYGAAAAANPQSSCRRAYKIIEALKYEISYQQYMYDVIPSVVVVPQGDMRETEYFFERLVEDSVLVFEPSHAFLKRSVDRCAQFFNVRQQMQQQSQYQQPQAPAAYHPQPAAYQPGQYPAAQYPAAQYPQQPGQYSAQPPSQYPQQPGYAQHQQYQQQPQQY